MEFTHTRSHRTSLAILMAAALLVIAAPRAARAQDRVVATVPFAFIVGDKELPPGQYLIRQDGESPSILAIESADGRRNVYVTTIGADDDRSASSAELVFRRYDNQYFLNRVVAGPDEEREIVLTRSEEHTSELQSRRDLVC